mmetsp:Transcript_33378/g.95881  ORF Transcript_33378/g.95881 Transcript_33378/m.95881 type:complete len:238 (-) Transcript_33378:116-829(-)
MSGSGRPACLLQWRQTRVSLQWQQLPSSSHPRRWAGMSSRYAWPRGCGASPHARACARRSLRVPRRPCRPCSAFAPGWKQPRCGSAPCGPRRAWSPPCPTRSGGSRTKMHIQPGSPRLGKAGKSSHQASCTASTSLPQSRQPPSPAEPVQLPTFQPSQQLRHPRCQQGATGPPAPSGWASGSPECSPKQQGWRQCHRQAGGCSCLPAQTEGPSHLGLWAQPRCVPPPHVALDQGWAR